MAIKVVIAGYRDHEIRQVTHERKRRLENELACATIYASPGSGFGAAMRSR